MKKTDLCQVNRISRHTPPIIRVGYGGFCPGEGFFFCIKISRNIGIAKKQNTF